MIDAAQIKEWLQAGLPTAEITLEGDGRHSEATIISSDFAGKSRLQRHRMVYAALGSKMGHEVHALSMQTLAPGEKP